MTKPDGLMEKMVERLIKCGVTSPNFVAEVMLNLVVGCVPPENGYKYVEDRFGWQECRKVLLDNMGVGE